MSTSSNSLLVKNLIEFGLSEKEAKIYLALLELEVAGVSEIAKTSNINRSSTYVVLEALKKKGLVSATEDKKVQEYVAVSPEMLLQEAKEKAQRVEDIKNNIGNIVPELKALHKDTRQRPKVRVFEGKQGLVNAFEETLGSKEKVMRASSSGSNIMKFLPEYFPNYLKKRIDLGIKMYGIHPNDDVGQQILKFSPKFDESVLIPPRKYNLLVDMAIWDDKVGFMSFEKNFTSISIESVEIANAMKSIFDLAFQEAKRLNQDINKKDDKKSR